MPVGRSQPRSVLVVPVPVRQHLQQATVDPATEPLGTIADDVRHRLGRVENAGKGDLLPHRALPGARDRNHHDPGRPTGAEGSGITARFRRRPRLPGNR
jgi:hypothetical protein